MRKRFVLPLTITLSLLLALFATATPQSAQAQGPLIRPKLKPALECIYTDDDSNTSWALWGYENTGNETVEAPVGGSRLNPPMNVFSENRNAGNPDRGQPTVFEPGLHEGLFWTPFESYRTTIFGHTIRNTLIWQRKKTARYWRMIPSSSMSSTCR
jgi:hypothetical protein